MTIDTADVQELNNLTECAMAIDYVNIQKPEDLSITTMKIDNDDI